MLTVGVELTTTVIEVVAVLPPLSVTEAVMRCVPERRFDLVIDGPVPRLPSRFEPHWMVREVSSKSLAVAMKETAAPCSKEALLAGAVMATVGVELTTTVIVAEALLPPLSVTDAVMVWVPELSVLLVREVPEPSAPSRLEVDWMLREVSSKSLAVVVKVMAWACSKEEPVAGPVMLMVGVEFTTTLTEVLALLPPESVTEAVMVWAPERKLLMVSEAPVPREPSRLEDQWTVRRASSKLDAVAVKVIAWPCSKDEPVAGPVMLMVGVEFTTTVIEALALLPPESVTEAVMVCVPERSVLMPIDVPLPRDPSRLEVQRMVRRASS